MKKVITIEKHKDPRIGFLSNSSLHPFVVESKKWPTVDHYLYAKMFEGTRYEEMIRRAPTVFKAKRMATLSKNVYDYDDGKRKTVEVYGGGIYRKRDDWKDVEMEVTETALRAKFKQHPRLQKLLINTGDSELVHINNVYTGPILEKIRSELQPSKTKPQRVYRNFQDFESENLTVPQTKLVRVIIQLSIKISRLEGWDTLHPEMVEDALLNLFGDQKLYHRFMSEYQNHIKEVKWSDIYLRYPNYEKVVNKVHHLILKKDPRQEKQLSVSLLISYVVWWYSRSSVKTQTLLNSRISISKNIDIDLGTGDRWYRKNPPRRPKVTKKPQLKKEGFFGLYIVDVSDGFCVRGEKKLLDTISEKLLRVGGEFPKMGETLIFRGEVLKKNESHLRKLGGVENKNGTCIKFRGKNLRRHRNELESMGGKYLPNLDTTQIKFREGERRKVSKIISSVKDIERPIGLADDWVKKRISYILDLAIQITKLLGKKEVEENIVNVSRQMYGVKFRKRDKTLVKIDHSSLIKEVLNSRAEYQKFTLTPSSKKIIARCVEWHFHPFEKLETYEEYQHKISEMKEEELRKVCTNIDVFTEVEVTILRAMHTLSGYLKNVAMYPPSEELYLHTLLCISPPGWRKSIRQFSNVYHQIQNSDEMLKLLQTFDADSSNKHSFGRLDLTNNDEKCIKIFYVGLEYLSPKLRKNGELLRKIASIGFTPRKKNIKPEEPEEIVVEIKESIENSEEPPSKITNIEEIASTVTTFEHCEWIGLLSSSENDEVNKIITQVYPYSDIYSLEDEKVPGTVVLSKPVTEDGKMASTINHRFIAHLITDSEDTFRESFKKVVKYLSEKEEFEIIFDKTQLSENHQKIMMEEIEGKEVIVLLATEKSTSREKSPKVERCQIAPKIIL